MAGTIPHTTDSGFRTDVLESDVPVVVNFWATWCGPCRAMAPHLQAIADDLGPKLKVVKVDIQQSPEVTRQFSVVSVPTLCIFKAGALVDKVVGNPGPRRLREWVDRNL